jgi:hypothetical protein
MRDTDFFQAEVGCFGSVNFRGAAGNGAGDLNTCAPRILRDAGRCCQCP